MISVNVLVIVAAALTGPAPSLHFSASETPVPAVEPAQSFRGETHESEQIDLYGGEEVRYEGNGESPRPSPPTATGSPQPQCPLTEYRWGIYSTRVSACDPVPIGEWTPWREQDEGEEADAESAVEPPQLIIVTREDVQSLIVQPGKLIVQPDRPWVLVNTETVVMTDAAEHIVGTEVLGLDVDVRVTPVLFTWDFGDGSVPVSGSDPGAPWPNHTVAHSYRQEGTAVISLRTEWDAAFRVEGTSTWLPVAGRAVTAQTAHPIQVVTASPRLTTDR